MEHIVSDEICHELGVVVSVCMTNEEVFIDQENHHSQWEICALCEIVWTKIDINVFVVVDYLHFIFENLIILMCKHRVLPVDSQFI